LNSGDIAIHLGIPPEFFTRVNRLGYYLSFWSCVLLFGVYYLAVPVPITLGGACPYYFPITLFVVLVVRPAFWCLLFGGACPYYLVPITYHCSVKPLFNLAMSDYTNVFFITP